MGVARSPFSMPFLTTLAAAVILVHSAEEGLESEMRRHEVSPRLSEPGLPDYDQSWRAVEVQPMMQQDPDPVEEWGDEISPQEPPKRRRPGRKRKRRPQPPPQEQDLVTEERRSYYPESRDQNHDLEFPAIYETPEPPRRRRKRPEGRNANRWLDDSQEPQRPHRRRGHRRKQRPIGDIDAIHVEHDQYDENLKVRPLHDHQNEDRKQEYVNLAPESREQVNIDNEGRSPALDDVSLDARKEMREENHSVSDISDSFFDTHFPTRKDLDDVQTAQTLINDKVNDKSYRVPYALARKQEQSSSETSSLKELLKKSGGLSLSEILQQRNLSLADLLNGKQNAISVLKLDNKIQEEPIKGPGKYDTNPETDITPNQNTIVEQQNSAEKVHITFPLELSTEPVLQTVMNMELVDKFESTNKDGNKNAPEEDKKEQATQKSMPFLTNRRRLLPGRRRQRIKVSVTNNGTLRFKQYLQSSTEASTVNIPLPREIENFVVPAIDIDNTKNETLLHSTVQDKETFTGTTIGVSTQNDETESQVQKDYTQTSLKPTQEATEASQATFITSTKTTVSKAAILSDMATTEMEKPFIATSTLRPKTVATNSELRIQALTNRLKKKRLRQKTPAPSSAEQIEMKDLFGMANLVSASEFITRVQTTLPTTSTTTESTQLSEARDISDINMTEQATTSKVNETQNIILPQTTLKYKVSTSTQKTSPLTTEVSAKGEILEVFKDTYGGARLSKILSERNMTINELVAHRERGSSQVHLADIFHNASKEPNPPEPFLSKSLIEPISKETYPLRALLDANHHDPAVKVSTQAPFPVHLTNIPMAMNYGPNVNENGENLGIVSLFNGFENGKTTVDENKLKKDSEGTTYFTSVMSINSTEEGVREGRSGFVGSKDIETSTKTIAEVQHFEKKLTQEMSPTSTESPTTTTTLKSLLEEDLDCDGLIVLEDLQQLNELDNSIARAKNEKLEVKLNDNTPTSDTESLLDKIPSSARSVTIASASIVGLTMILFLLTYIGCKWRQQRKNIIRKEENLNGERIPSPIFENRKLNKNNCSNRSISPMLASSNVYTMSTLDSRNGKESPDYMWDTLRKPFQ